jgi:hypothetical protein
VRFRRSDKQQFLEAVQTEQILDRLQHELDRLQRMMDRMEANLTEVTTNGSDQR